MAGVDPALNQLSDVERPSSSPLKSKLNLPPVLQIIERGVSTHLRTRVNPYSRSARRATASFVRYLSLSYPARG